MSNQTLHRASENDLTRRFQRAIERGDDDNDIERLSRFLDNLDERRGKAKEARALSRNPAGHSDDQLRKAMSLLDLRGDRKGVQRIEQELDRRESRSGGKPPISREQLRRDFDEYVETQLASARAATRGVMLNADGRRAGISERDLWQLPARSVQAYGSEELLRYWQRRPRVTFSQFVNQQTGGRAVEAESSRQANTRLAPERNRANRRRTVGAGGR